MNDNDFIEFDDNLYSAIEKALKINTDKWSMNGDPKLFDWYCNTRNNLIKEIDKVKKEFLTNG